MFPQVRQNCGGKIATVGIEKASYVFCSQLSCVRKTCFWKCTSWPFLNVLSSGFKCICLSVHNHHSVSLELSSSPTETVLIITTPHCFSPLKLLFYGFCGHLVYRDLHSRPVGLLVTGFCLAQQNSPSSSLCWNPTVWMGHGMFIHLATEWCLCKHRHQASHWGSTFSSLGYLEMGLLGHMVVLCLIFFFQEWPYCFPWWLH